MKGTVAVFNPDGTLGALHHLEAASIEDIHTQALEIAKLSATSATERAALTKHCEILQAEAMERSLKADHEEALELNAQLEADIAAHLAAPDDMDVPPEMRAEDNDPAYVRHLRTSEVQASDDELYGYDDPPCS